ncbi:MAG: acetyl-CoA carboxylase carboxyltransferase subunit beta [Verrucomicrobia bacterium]|nr:acetyl-CoA carboxylase carboxyltransferase subunit beta [Verrucomicrobiota bacterium]
MAAARKLKVQKAPAKKVEIPEGLWTKCKGCDEVIYNRELDENQRICPKCGAHFSVGAWQRIASLVEQGSFQEMDSEMVSVDLLKFTGVDSYPEKLKQSREDTGLKDAVITGIGNLGAHRMGLAVMDFRFMGASMGSVVGEKITRLIERCTAERLACVVINASGGARMQEGLMSLMQMAKTSAALARHAQARLPYISVLTHPTYAGVMASYASLGDLILAEPGAMIGFAGPRVIKDTTQSELPHGFQTSEFLLERGLIDMVVPRKQLKATLVRALDYLLPPAKPAAQPAAAV